MIIVETGKQEIVFVDATAAVMKHDILQIYVGLGVIAEFKEFHHWRTSDRDDDKGKIKK